MWQLYIQNACFYLFRRPMKWNRCKTTSNTRCIIMCCGKNWQWSTRESIDKKVPTTTVLCVIVPTKIRNKTRRKKRSVNVWLEEIQKEFWWSSQPWLFLTIKNFTYLYSSPKVNKAQFLETYFLSRFEQVIDLICYLNKFLYSNNGSTNFRNYNTRNDDYTWIINC